MSESPNLGGIGNDAAESFAQVIATIRRDMEAIEKSAQSIKQNLTSASNSSGGITGGANGGAGGTGASKPQGLGLASISPTGVLRGAAAGFGALTGGLPGAIGLAALPDLIPRAQQAMDFEAAKFGVAQATGDFGTFRNIMSGAKNDFNVQNMQAFQNSIVYGTQRAGMIGLAGGVSAASAQIGGYNTLAALAGIDQAAVPGMMKNSLSSQTYYGGLAAGVFTRNPVTGETIGLEGQINQIYDNSGLGRFNTAKQLDQIDITYGEGSAGRRQLLEQYGGDENMVDTIINGMRIRARSGQALKENQVQDQMKDVGAAGGLGTKDSRAMEETRRLEGERLDLLAEHVDDATEGIAKAAGLLADSVEHLTNLEGTLEKLLGQYISISAGMDVAAKEIPGAMSSVTSGLGSIGDMLMSAAAGKFLLGGAGTKVAGAAGRLFGLSRLGLPGLAVAGVGAVGLGVAEIIKRNTDYDEKGRYEVNTMIGQNAGKNRSASGYGDYHKSKGDWFVEADQDGRIHYGEMVLPARVANAVREELAVGKTSPLSQSGRGNTTVTINLTVSRATDQEAVMFARRVKREIEGDNELFLIGDGRM